jgi:serine/threonine protein kinase
VIDFGISRALDVSSTLSGGRAVGTPAYMSPEQLRGHDADTAMDVFAFGATLVFAATGSPPFGQDSIPAVMSRILTGEPDLGDLSGPLRDLAAACLDKDPARRPNAREALLALLGHNAAPIRPENAPGEALALLADGGTGAAEASVPPRPAEQTSSGRAGRADGRSSRARAAAPACEPPHTR